MILGGSMNRICFNLLLGFLIALMIAPWCIRWLRSLKVGQPILGYVDTHISKQGTPTMGGIIFLLGLMIVFCFTIGQYSKLTIIIFATTIAYGLLGFLDDFIKVKFKQNEGLKPYQKIIGQVGIAVLIALFVYQSNLVGTDVYILFFHTSIDFGWLIIPFVIFLLLAMTNSVNLTDGLDGLAGSVSVVYLILFSILLMGHIKMLENNGESLAYLAEMKNILYLCAGFLGCILAFLCFNTYPAKVFMGDTGSLAIGGFLGMVAIMTKFYLWIPFFGIMFVLSAISDVLQVGYYKMTKKRIFLMAPLHHHFERKGYSESKIVYAYCVVTFLVGIVIISFA